MIELKHGFSRQRLFANHVSLLDLIVPATYQHYEGRYIPLLYKKTRRYTNVIDLTQDTEVLLAKMKSNTRNEVRRAEREGVVCEFTEDLAGFVPFYNAFAQEKGLDSSLTIHGLEQYGNVLVGVSKHDEAVLSMHATAFDDCLHKALLLYSCSPRIEEDVDRKLIGRGNRYLHFREFEHFKQMGMTEYDWNGVCLDPEQTERYNIGLFKQAFGGENKENIWLESPLYIMGDWFRKKMGISNAID